MERRKVRDMVNRLQRRVELRVCCAFRTVVMEVALVGAGLPLIELLVQERCDRYEGVKPMEAKGSLCEAWKLKWQITTTAAWTKRLIPDVKR